MKDFADATVRVRYAETDQMGVVYHGNYFTWFEVGRVELCRHLGFEYKQMESEDDTFIVVAEASCRYKRSARFDDVLAASRVITASRCWAAWSSPRLSLVSSRLAWQRRVSG